MQANYSRGGTKAVKTILKAAKYYTFREGPDLAQRVWHTSDGRVALYNEVQAELAAGAKASAYTYRVVLSTKDVDLGPAGYHQVLAGHFERYSFIEHHNTEFPHAHVIGFRTERVKKAELQALLGTLMALEQARAQQQAQVWGNDVELQGSRPLRRERPRDDGLEYGGSA
jgi:hypothetical protein